MLGFLKPARLLLRPPFYYDIMPPFYGFWLVGVMEGKGLLLVWRGFWHMAFTYARGFRNAEDYGIQCSNESACFLSANSHIHTSSRFN